MVIQILACWGANMNTHLPWSEDHLTAVVSISLSRCALIGSWYELAGIFSEATLGEIDPTTGQSGLKHEHYLRLAVARGHPDALIFQL